MIPNEVYILFELDGKVAKVIDDPQEVADMKAGRLAWAAKFNAALYKRSAERTPNPMDLEPYGPMR